MKITRRQLRQLIKEAVNRVDAETAAEEAFLAMGIVRPDESHKHVGIGVP